MYNLGGGVIVWDEKIELENYGICQIFQPEDGRRLGLEGMINRILTECDFDPREVKLNRIPKNDAYKKIFGSDPIPQIEIGRALQFIELGDSVDLKNFNLESFKNKNQAQTPVIGITGTGGAGKSSLIDEIALRFLHFFPKLKLGIACVDPSKRKTGGALLGDRIRMNSLSRDRIFMHSLATRGSGIEVSKQLTDVLELYRKLDFDLIIAETSGIGQASSQITDLCDIPLYVMTSEYGAPTQLEKIDMIDFAHIIAINKSDRRGSLDALKAVQKQYNRSRKQFNESTVPPVFLTQAAQFNDAGVNHLFFEMIEQVSRFQDGKSKSGEVANKWFLSAEQKKSVIEGSIPSIIPGHRTQYLLEIVNSVRNYKKRVSQLADELSVVGALSRLGVTPLKDKLSISDIEGYSNSVFKKLEEAELAELKNWDSKGKIYQSDEMVFKVRDKEFRNPLTTTSLSGSKIRKVVFPKFRDWGDRFRFLK